MAFLRVIEVISGPRGGQGTKITDLKITFDIIKTSSKTPNKAQITIYNLSKQTAKLMTTHGNHLTLRTGYQDETVAAIFFGDIDRGVTYMKGTERITEIEAYEGQSKTSSHQVSLSFAENTPLSVVLQAATDPLGFPVKGLELIPTGAMYQEKGFSFIGMAVDAVKEILARVGLTYTIQNEQLMIMVPGGVAETSGLLLTAESGLITVPSPIDEKANPPTASTPVRWKFISLLFPELNPGAAFTVKSNTANGVLRVDTAHFSGDNWTDKFQVEVEARAI